MANESTTPEAIRRDLHECLKSIEVSGSFATHGTIKNPPNPDIFLTKGGGLIGLPLSKQDADTLIAASHRAPFGKGEQTILDTSVRKTWELSPADFEIRNPEWVEFLSSIVFKASVNLGIDTVGQGVCAQLYKLLLYDEGAMFKAHQE